MNELFSIDSISDFIENEEIAVLYFHSPDCGVCTSFLPKLEKMLTRYPQIQTSKINIKEVPAVSGAFNVFTIPCVLGYIDGKEIIREARYLSILDLEDKIKRYIDILSK